MSREDIREHIAEELRKSELYPGDGRPTEAGNDDDGLAEVAICVLRCKECGDVNGKEPRPVNCPDIMETCEECDDFLPHEVVPRSVHTGGGR